MPKKNLDLKSIYDFNYKSFLFYEKVQAYSAELKEGIGSLAGKVFFNLLATPKSQAYSLTIQKDVQDFLGLKSEGKGRADGVNKHGSPIEIKYAKCSYQENTNDWVIQVKQLRKDHPIVLVVYDPYNPTQESKFVSGDSSAVNNFIYFYLLPKNVVNGLYNVGTISHGSKSHNSLEKHCYLKASEISKFKVTEAQLKKKVNAIR